MGPLAIVTVMCSSKVSERKLGVSVPYHQGSKPDENDAYEVVMTGVFVRCQQSGACCPDSVTLTLLTTSAAIRFEPNLYMLKVKLSSTSQWVIWWSANITSRISASSMLLPYIFDLLVASYYMPSVLFCFFLSVSSGFVLLELIRLPC